MELKRRDFLKITGLLGAGFLGKVDINEADPYNVWKPIRPEQLEKTGTVCPLCQSYCNIEIWKKRELIFGLYKKGEGKGICPKIVAYHNVIYGEDRIITPLLRVKERGTFAFKPIDYDKALSIIKDKISKGGFFTDAIASGESERFYLSNLSEKINFHPDCRVKAVFGADKLYFDIYNADLVINFGSDLLNKGDFIKDAQFLSENAKKVVSLTPMVTKGTALGESWYPVKLSELANIVKKMGELIFNKSSNIQEEWLKEVANRIKSSKKVCLTFSPSILEFNDGVSAAKEIVSLAKSLNTINKPGGMYFYNAAVPSRPFDFIRDNINNYLVYNVDTSLLYPVKEAEEKLKNIPFILYLGNHHSDVSLYADLIMPLPFFTERSEAYIKRDVNGFKQINASPAIAGGVESYELRKKENIEVLFQKMLNFKAPYGIKDISELARLIKPSLPTSQSYLSKENKTGLPTIMPNLTTKENLTAEVKEIELCFYSQNVLDFLTIGSKWAEEMDSRNSLLINTNTAKKFNLKHKDDVILKTNKGNIKGKVFVFEGIADNTIGLNRFKKKAVIGSPYKVKKKSKDKEVKLVWWKDQSLELENLLSFKPINVSVATLEYDKIEIIKG